MESMKLELSPDIFKTLVQSISLVDDVTFMVTPERVFLQEQDPGKVSMVEVDFPKTVFKKYIVPEKKIFKVSMDRLKRIAKQVKQNDTVTILLDEQENILKVIIHGKYIRTHTVALQPADDFEPKQLNLPVLARIKMIPETLREIIKSLKKEDYVIFRAEMKRFIIETRNFGGEITSVEIQNEEDNGIILEYTVPEPCTATYPISYLSDMVNVPASDIVTIYFATDMPLKLSYLLEGGGRINYYLAPRRGET